MKQVEFGGIQKWPGTNYVYRVGRNGSCRKEHLIVTCTKIATTHFIKTLIKGTRIQHKESKGMFTWRWEPYPPIDGILHFKLIMINDRLGSLQRRGARSAPPKTG